MTKQNPETLNDFTKAVLKYIKAVPKGKVATYGQIAALAGKPQGSRGVAWILHSLSEMYNLPWQRIIGHSGKISFPENSSYFKKQKRLLEKEGVKFSSLHKIDLQKFQWKKQAPKAKKSKSRPQMFSTSST